MGSRETPASSPNSLDFMREPYQIRRASRFPTGESAFIPRKTPRTWLFQPADGAEFCPLGEPPALSVCRIGIRLGLMLESAAPRVTLSGGEISRAGPGGQHNLDHLAGGRRNSRRGVATDNPIHAGSRPRQPASVTLSWPQKQPKVTIESIPSAHAPQGSIDLNIFPMPNSPDDRPKDASADAIGRP